MTQSKRVRAKLHANYFLPFGAILTILMLAISAVLSYQHASTMRANAQELLESSV